jgi:hypothetical protein
MSPFLSILHQLIAFIQEFYHYLQKNITQAAPDILHLDAIKANNIHTNLAYFH